MRFAAATLFLFALAALTPAADDFKVEAGFTPLFNGKDLSGWKVRKGGEALDGKDGTPDKRFVVKEGELLIDTKVKGDVWIETAKEFGKDVTIRFDYLPGKGCNNDMDIRGIKFDIKADPIPSDIKNIKVGEWNQFEIIVKGDRVEFKNNGESVKTQKATKPSTVFGVRAEAGPAQYRRFRYMEAK